MGRGDWGWHLCPLKKGALVGKTKRGKGSKLMLLTDSRGIPLGVHLDSASPAELNLIEDLLDRVVLQGVSPHHLLYDKTADSDPLLSRLKLGRAVELVTPHRRGRKRPPTQDGRRLRRYNRRWKVERTISWLTSCRRVATRHEYYPELYLGFVQFACAFTILKKF